jgi:hypothetical protein
MRILMVGLGGIGQRHVRNLRVVGRGSRDYRLAGQALVSRRDTHIAIGRQPGRREDRYSHLDSLQSALAEQPRSRSSVIPLVARPSRSGMLARGLRCFSKSPSQTT